MSVDDDAQWIRAAFRGQLGRFALDVAFTVPAHGVTALFGPSGCGKTSVLRCIAGLQRVSEGMCSIAGEVWQDETTFRPVHRRPIGYVFQEASLFPHLCVEKNLIYGARRARPRPGQALVTRDEVVALLGLKGLLERAPHRLSGGERQRVAIGRALLSQPALLLMDEPLSALDKPTRDEILPFLERLHATLAIPILYVSHDMAEVERLADTLILMERGRIVACGPLGMLQSDPALPLLRARDAAVSLDGIAAHYDPAFGLLEVEVKGGRFLVPSPPLPAGERRRLRILAGDVSLTTRSPVASTIVNILPARIIDLVEAGPAEIIVTLALGPEGSGATLLSRVTRFSAGQLGLAPGQPVFAQVKGVALLAGPGAGR